MNRRALLLLSLSVAACDAKGPSLPSTSAAGVVTMLPISSDGPVQFNSATWTSNGWIVADESVGKLFLISDSGAVKWFTKGLGRGPGELLSIQLLGEADSVIAVYDGRQRKLCYFRRADGSLVREMRINMVSSFAGSDVVGLVGQDSLVAVALDSAYRSLIGPVRPKASVLLLDSAAGFVKLAEYRGSELLRGQSGTRSMEILRPLGKRSGISVSAGKIFAFDGDSLAVIDRSANRWRSEFLQLPETSAIPLSSDASKYWISHEYSFSGPFANGFVDLMSKYPAPSAIPSWGQGGASFDSPLKSGVDGELFLRQFTADAAERWWRRSRAGVWTVVTLPPRAEVLAFAASRALVRISSDSSERLGVLVF